MAIGAYTMAILTVDTGWRSGSRCRSRCWSRSASRLLVGLPSLRLRADYFAIATIASAGGDPDRRPRTRAGSPAATRASSATTTQRCFDDTWLDVSDTIDELSSQDLGWADPDVARAAAPGRRGSRWSIVAVRALRLIRRTPWGRVLRAVREDEDAARALGKNVFAYKLQSLAIAAGDRRGRRLVPGSRPRSSPRPTSSPSSPSSRYAVLILGGLASYWGVIVGSVILWIVLEGTRFLDLPLYGDERHGGAAVRRSSAWS